MARHRGRRRELKSEINIVPLLDVLLVLLLIFMATAPIISQSVEVDPPVILEVSGVGRYTLVVKQDRLELLPEEQIIAAAKQYLAEDPKTIFLVGGAKDVPYEEIINGLNILKQAGVKSVGLMTKPM